jgi:hypothetical protein
MQTSSRDGQIHSFAHVITARRLAWWLVVTGVAAERAVMPLGGRQVMQDLATGGRGVPRVIDGRHCPAETQASHAALRRRSASGYVGRHHHA